MLGELVRDRQKIVIAEWKNMCTNSMKICFWSTTTSYDLTSTQQSLNIYTEHIIYYEAARGQDYYKCG